MQYQIMENAQITHDVFLLDAAGDTRRITAPGQFVQIQVPGFFLRRPISVCDWDENGVTLIYKTVGQGTEALARMEKGTMLDVLPGLGNGYDLTETGEHPLVIGGGVGVPPLFALTKKLIQKGVKPTVILGFNKASEIFLYDEMMALGVPVILATADGSAGEKGFVTDVLPKDYDYFFACGPLPMLKAMYRACPTPGQLSLEERMACGFGACMGCSMETKNGPKRVCKDGPVFRKEELLW